jgi:methylase of polypeptide subunit release factors
MSDMIKEKKTDQIRNEWFGDVEVDYDIVFINSKEPQMDLLQMLQKDSTNRMAVEYLLSYFMLECRVNQVEYYILRYGGYDPGNFLQFIRKHYCFKQLMKNIPDEELPYTISNEIKNKMAKFNKVIIEYNFDDQKAKKYLYRLYGDTFWYYFRYQPLNNRI